MFTPIPNAIKLTDKTIRWRRIRLERFPTANPSGQAPGSGAAG